MIKLIKSTFYKEEYTKKKLINFISTASQLSIGPECEKFEKNFAKYQGRKHCVFFNSGSSANLAVIQALLNLNMVKKGDLAGFSSLTWATNPMPLIQLGLNATPIDVELTTLNVSSKKLLKVLEQNKIKLLFLTNLLGFCDDIDKIKKVCEKNNIILLEDNCESLGTIYKKKKLGNYGLASTFSFFVGHHMSTIEGGAVCTDDDELNIMLKLVRAHGWDRNLGNDEQLRLRKMHNVDSTFYSKYTFYDLGFNLRPNEINGHIGNLQLKYLDEIVKKREDNFKKLAGEIYKHKEKYYPIKYDHIDLISNFAVPLVCRTREIRDELIKKCEGKIEIRPVVGGNMTSQPFFKKYMSKYAQEKNGLNAELINENGLYFGNNPELTQKEIKEIINIFTS
jgi:CDP-6-deoxy-D-xylo-4-hexulose-3-dehydrase